MGSVANACCKSVYHRLTACAHLRPLMSVAGMSVAGMSIATGQECKILCTLCSCMGVVIVGSARDMTTWFCTPQKQALCMKTKMIVILNASPGLSHG